MRGEMIDMLMNEDERPLFMISVAAELAGVHPQTLRAYESKGLVSPKRTAGNTRMYSRADIARVNLINDLTAEGINLAGVIRILDLEERLKDSERHVEQLQKVRKQLEKDLHDLRMKAAISAIVKVEDDQLHYPWDI